MLTINTDNPRLFRLSACRSLLGQVATVQYLLDFFVSTTIDHMINNENLPIRQLYLGILAVLNFFEFVGGLRDRLVAYLVHLLVKVF